MSAFFAFFEDITHHGGLSLTVQDLVHMATTFFLLDRLHLGKCLSQTVLNLDFTQELIIAKVALFDAAIRQD